ncbi:MAG: hypothetical protein QOK33_1266 [Mycobacterium sp.]|nr:hypothetical protein [Mycobacterium sp.]
MLPHTVVGLFDDQILDESGARHDRRANARRGVFVHVGPLAPIGVGRRQLQADPVVEDVRWCVDLEMQRTP